MIAADNVVVQNRFDGNPFGDRSLRVQPRAHEPLLLADVAHEHERRVEVDAALAENARQLHSQRRAAAVVVDAGREVVERRVGVGGRRRRRVGIARRAGRISGALPAWTRHRVVVAADVDPPRAPAWQHRHDVAHLDVARHAALRRDLIGVEADLQIRAVTRHLGQDPLTGSPDPARRRGCR